MHTGNRKFSQCSLDLFTGSVAHSTYSSPRLWGNSDTVSLCLAGFVDKIDRRDREFRYNMVNEIESVLIEEGDSDIKALVVRYSDVEKYINKVMPIYITDETPEEYVECLSTVFPLNIYRSQDLVGGYSHMPTTRVVTFPVGNRCKLYKAGAYPDLADNFTNAYEWLSQEDLIVYPMDYADTFVGSGSYSPKDVEDTDYKVFIGYHIFDGAMQRGIYSNEGVRTASTFTT